MSSTRVTFSDRRLYYNGAAIYDNDFQEESDSYGWANVWGSPAGDSPGSFWVPGQYCVQDYGTYGGVSRAVSTTVEAIVVTIAGNYEKEW